MLGSYVTNLLEPVEGDRLVRAIVEAAESLKLKYSREADLVSENNILVREKIKVSTKNMLSLKFKVDIHRTYSELSIHTPRVNKNRTIDFLDELYGILFDNYEELLCSECGRANL